MKLYEAFGVVRGDVVSLIGAGGKTAALVTLGHELAEKGWRVLATTTTRIGRDQLALMPYSMPATSTPSAISAALHQYGFVFLHGELTDQKVHGMSAQQINELIDTVDSDVFLIEADGARGKLLKAPYPHEPVIPLASSLVIPIVSIGILGKPLTEAFVYNPEAIDAKYGFGLGNAIKSPWVAQIMRDPDLMMKDIPPHARVIGFVNGVPASGYLVGRARMIAQLALRMRNHKRTRDVRKRRLHGVVIGAARASEPAHEIQRPVGVIVLAAGMSTRMGQMKVLLSWSGGRSILQHIVHQLNLARLDIDTMVIVTGHDKERVVANVQHLDVSLVHNAEYAQGEMLSSLKAGLAVMPDYVSAVLVVLGDQPRIQPKTIQKILGEYALGQHGIIAPSYDMRRGHPILIDRKYWREILDLPVDGAPRDVINQHHDDIGYVVVDNDSVLKDVDTPQSYLEERRRAGLD